MRITVVGTGYVGLVSGACLAAKGHTVTCVDIDADKVRVINEGRSPIHEAGLEELMSQHLGTRLFASTDLAASIAESSLTLVAVGTPFDGERIDLGILRAACEQIGSCLRTVDSYHSVVVKSTVVPGTTDKIVGPILEQTSGKRIGAGIGLGVNPEFLTEGVAVNDFMFPDRIVIGGADETTVTTLRELYQEFEDVPVVETNNKTAEMIKYASNSLLATMISFSNEIANLSAAIGGIDAVDVMHGVHLSHYLSPLGPDGHRSTAPIASFLEAGCGFGGSCLPKDVQSLIAHGKAVGQPMHVLDAVMQVNKFQHDEVTSRLTKHFESLDGVPVSVLGLSFKPDTDDMRESPAIPIIRSLQRMGAVVTGYDPVASAEARLIFADGVHITDSLRQAVETASAVVVVTRWKEFEILDEVLADVGSSPLVVDGRRMLDRRLFAHYEGIGL